MLLKNVLCPVDFSPASLRAFDYSIKLAQNYGAHLHLLNVIAPVVRSAYDFAVDTKTRTASLKKQSLAELRNLKKVAADTEVDTDTEVRTGEVANEIRDCVKARKTDMVVLGKHGRNRIGRWLMGSVTERLLRQLPVPMLIISEGKAKRATPPDVITEVESGVPFKMILSFLEKNRPDLLVINIHGKGALERTLLGSTAERVIRGAPCPVLAIPPRKSSKRRVA